MQHVSCNGYARYVAENWDHFNRALPIRRHGGYHTLLGPARRLGRMARIHHRATVYKITTHSCHTSHTHPQHPHGAQTRPRVPGERGGGENNARVPTTTSEPLSRACMLNLFCDLLV